MLGDTAKDPEPLQIQLRRSTKSLLCLEPLTLLSAGHASSLAPANRRAWSSLGIHKQQATAPICLHLSIQKARPRVLALLELLMDPQTCGPLLISVTPSFAEALLVQSSSTVGMPLDKLHICKWTELCKRA